VGAFGDKYRIPDRDSGTFCSSMSSWRIESQGRIDQDE
jgi:hypothetical protein